ncbi:MAG: aspartate 1-decarboxylase [Pseudomonadota bacterium]
MLRIILRAKIHRATITGADLAYEGSLTLDPVLMRVAGLVPFEMIKVYNVSNGERFETYVIEGEEGSGQVVLNGAAARKGAPGDKVIIAAYALATDDELEDLRPRLVRVDEGNRPL